MQIHTIQYSNPINPFHVKTEPTRKPSSNWPGLCNIFHTQKILKQVPTQGNWSYGERLQDAKENQDQG